MISINIKKISIEKPNKKPASIRISVLVSIGISKMNAMYKKQNAVLNKTRLRNNSTCTNKYTKNNTNCTMPERLILVHLLLISPKNLFHFLTYS